MHRLLLTASWFCLLCLSTCLVSAKDPPPATVVPVPREGGWMTRQNSINDRAKQGDVDLIFLGDSITQGWNDNAVWKKYYGSRKAMNAGIGGDRTQHVLWRLDNGNIAGITPKLAVIMIGTNNSGTDTPEDIAAGIRAIVAKLRDKLPSTKVLVLGIFPRGEKPDDKHRLITSKTNELIKDIGDGKMVYYLDIGPNFLEADGTLTKQVMPDLLHLSEQGYEIWAKGIEPKVVELTGK